MKNSKLGKASEGEDGVDMISNLPDPILHMILSLIPTTEEVIRTSILSTRWRYLWTSVPSVDIDYTRGQKPLQKYNKSKFKEFVYWVLLNKHLDLDSFRLWCADYYNMSTIRQWIHATVMRKVKQLDLMFCPKNESEDIELPNSLVTCGSLEVLRLCLLEGALKIPKITGFPALRVLELNDVNVSRSSSQKYFLESCPLLEDLSLIDCIIDEFSHLCILSQKLKTLRIEEHCYEIGEGRHSRMVECIQISCPRLVFLKLTGSIADEFLFENLHSLKEAVIHIKDFYDEPTFDLFGKISHVESLSIIPSCIRELFDSEVYALPNLKTLEITVDDRFSMDALIPFLPCIPDLESLHLIIPKNTRHGHGWIDEAATMSILTPHLKKVEFLEFDEEEPKLGVARALLEHGLELEEMVFSWGDEAKFRERSMETITQVSKFHMASSTVKLKAVINPIQAKPTPLLHLHD